MKKVYIVTGANGFLGNNIIRNIKLDADDEIRALVRSRSNVDSLNGLNCSIHIGDVTDVNSLDGIFDVSNAKLFVFIVRLLFILRISMIKMFLMLMLMVR